ncbi:MAG: poly-gamma-glutamate hydrolase family protein [Anaerolineae bacterium]|nr:poly-gamma-glutamate hydrolase family protein [Anaerolineae bacterium]
MSDKFASFAALSKKYQYGVGFLIRRENRGKNILIFAPHGGGIERGTSEIVRAIACDDLSYYLFEGCLNTYKENRRLHITSANFDEPKCLSLIKHFDTSLAIHGCRGVEPIIYVGGRDAHMKEKMIVCLFAKGYPVQDGKRKYEGVFPRNICNRTKSGKGVQIELSTAFRKSLFANWKVRSGRENTTKLFKRFVSDVREIIQHEVIPVGVEED